MKAGPRGVQALAVRINDQLKQINKAATEVGAMPHGPEWRTSYENLVADYLNALQLIRLARFVGVKGRDADRLAVQEAFTLANVGFYWSEVHRDGKETARWLEAAFKGGLLQQIPLDKLLAEEGFDPVRDDTEFQKLVERYR